MEHRYETLVVILLFVPLTALGMLTRGQFDVYVSLPGYFPPEGGLLEHRWRISVTSADEMTSGTADWPGHRENAVSVERRIVQGSRALKTENDLVSEYEKKETVKEGHTGPEHSSSSPVAQSPEGCNRHPFLRGARNQRPLSCSTPVNLVLTIPHHWEILEGQTVSVAYLNASASADSQDVLYIQKLWDRFPGQSNPKLSWNSTRIELNITNTLSYLLHGLVEYSRERSWREGPRLSRMSSQQSDTDSGLPEGSLSPDDTVSKGRSFTEPESGIAASRGSRNSGSPCVLQSLFASLHIRRSTRKTELTGFPLQIRQLSTAFAAPGFVDPLFGINCNSTIILHYNEESGNYALQVIMPDPLNSGQQLMFFIVPIGPEALSQTEAENLHVPQVAHETEELLGTFEMENSVSNQGAVATGGSVVESQEATVSPPFSDYMAGVHSLHTYETITLNSGEGDQQPQDLNDPQSDQDEYGYTLIFSPRARRGISGDRASGYIAMSSIGRVRSLPPALGGVNPPGAAPSHPSASSPLNAGQGPSRNQDEISPNIIETGAIALPPQQHHISPPGAVYDYARPRSIPVQSENPGAIYGYAWPRSTPAPRQSQEGSAAAYGIQRLAGNSRIQRQAVDQNDAQVSMSVNGYEYAAGWILAETGQEGEHSSGTGSADTGVLAGAAGSSGASTETVNTEAPAENLYANADALQLGQSEGYTVYQPIYGNLHSSGASVAATSPPVPTPQGSGAQATTSQPPVGSTQASTSALNPSNLYDRLAPRPRSAPSQQTLSKGDRGQGNRRQPTRTTCRPESEDNSPRSYDPGNDRGGRKPSVASRLRTSTLRKRTDFEDYSNWKPRASSSSDSQGRGSNRNSNHPPEIDHFRAYNAEDVDERANAFWPLLLLFTFEESVHSSQTLLKPLGTGALALPISTH